MEYGPSRGASEDSQGSRCVEAEHGPRRIRVLSHTHDAQGGDLWPRRPAETQRGLCTGEHCRRCCQAITERVRAVPVYQSCSLSELETLLLVAERLGYQVQEASMATVVVVRKKLLNLIKYMKTKAKARQPSNGLRLNPFSLLPLSAQPHGGTCPKELTSIES